MVMSHHRHPPTRCAVPFVGDEVDWFMPKRDILCVYCRALATGETSALSVLYNQFVYRCGNEGFIARQVVERGANIKSVFLTWFIGKKNNC